MPARTPSQQTWIAVLVLWIGTYFAARYALELTPAGSSLRIAIALTPLLPTLLLLWVVWRGVHEMDELQRRVHLEALAVAFPLCIVLLWVLGLLELATDLDQANWGFRHVWALLPLFYFVGLAMAWRRYR